ETSYGNAGLIQREAVIPYTFPRELSVVLSYAMNHRRDVRASSTRNGLPSFLACLFTTLSVQPILVLAKKVAAVMRTCSQRGRGRVIGGVDQKGLESRGRNNVEAGVGRGRIKTGNRRAEKSE
ncbi:MAG TPA: hypothetical protein VJ349_09130, partial [Stellaceae bacterium]|nr:hypothetical protein [Stellaceae bacterium]